MSSNAEFIYNLLSESKLVGTPICGFCCQPAGSGSRDCPSCGQFYMEKSMKYLCIDIETGGLDSDVHPMIEFGAVWDDGESAVTELATFRALIVRRDGNYTLNSYCVIMHQDLFREILDVDWDEMKEGGYEQPHPQRATSYCQQIVCTVEQLGVWFRGWLDRLGVGEKVNVAGKNFESFDAKWTRNLLLESGIKIRRRLIDPAMLFVRPEDEELPNLKTCCERADVVLDPVKHHGAVYDALTVVRLLRASGALYGQ